MIAVTGLLCVLLVVISPCLLSLENCGSNFTLEECSMVNCTHLNSCVLYDVVNISNTALFSLEGDIRGGTDITCLNSSGFVLINVSTVIIANVRFFRCGVSHSLHGRKLAGALILVRCGTVDVTDSVIEESRGTGLILLNIYGNMNICRSSFDSNISGGGLRIEQFDTDHSTVTNTLIISVANTNFTNNSATAFDGCDSNSGGGIAISLTETLQHIHISLSDCYLLKNSASHGGGIQIKITTPYFESFFYLNRLIFVGNMADRGGGGIYIELSEVTCDTSNLSINVSSSTFDGNNATFGGGAFLTFPVGQIIFEDCTWINNLAHYGSALDVYPTKPDSNVAMVPMVYCVGNSTFVNNKNWDVTLYKIVYRRGYGVIMVSGFKIAFRGEIVFESNSGSCIYAIGSELIFQEESNIKFINNYGEDGAGIALIGLSVILADDNTSFMFCNNSVERFGAGIYYHSLDKHRYVGLNHFFFQSLKRNGDITFHFLGNVAPKDPSHPQHALHEQAVYSYAGSQGDNSCNNTDTRCWLREARSIEIRNDSRNCEPEIIHVSNKTVADDDKTNFNYSGVKFIIPGVEETFCDGVCLTLFRASVSGDDGVNIPSEYEYNFQKFTLSGMPGSMAEVILHGQSFQDIHIKFEVTLLHCPPLYKLSTSDECHCYRNDEVHFATVFKCTSDKSSEMESYSSIKVGYWLGYDNSSDVSGRKFLMAYCPTGYCRTIDSNCRRNDSNCTTKDSMIPLPFTYYRTNDELELDGAVCDNRRGHLCGECMPETAVHFHSHSFKCKSTSDCRYGSLLFLLSEIVPVTIIFLLLIFLNIKLTSGGIAGLIFFAQIYESINIKLERLSNNYFNFHHLFYQLFNFDFLELNGLSFCLGKTVTTLDVLALKYLVSVYPLTLISITVLLIRFSGRFKCCKFNACKVSIVQVISTFIVVVYSKCTSVSFRILWYQDLYHEKTCFRTVVALQGNLEYFSEGHLPYAMLALFMLFVFTLPLPAILLVYPLSNKLMSRLNISDSILVKFLSKKMPLYKLLPLFDCFQGTFKDNYRFFSGLYFLYRITILISLFANLVSFIYLFIVIQLIAMLLIHVLAWPYKNNVHNIIDALLFANLAVISSLKLLMFLMMDVASPKAIEVVHVIEMVLVNLPILVVVVYLLYRASWKVYMFYEMRRSSEDAIDTFFLSDHIREEFVDDYDRMNKIQ